MSVIIETQLQGKCDRITLSKVSWGVRQVSVRIYSFRTRRVIGRCLLTTWYKSTKRISLGQIWGARGLRNIAYRGNWHFSVFTEIDLNGKKCVANSSTTLRLQLKLVTTRTIYSDAFKDTIPIILRSPITLRRRIKIGHRVLSHPVIRFWSP